MFLIIIMVYQVNMLWYINRYIIKISSECTLCVVSTEKFLDVIVFLQVRFSIKWYVIRKSCLLNLRI